MYRSRFIDPVRIRAGARFWERNRTTLARAQAEFGVPPEIIVGIVGVETIYGQNMGSFRVMDALATLTFDFPPQHPRAQARHVGQIDGLADGGAHPVGRQAAPRGQVVGKAHGLGALGVDDVGRPFGTRPS